MKLNLSKWLRPASASTEELEQQLSNAEQQYSEAITATQAARESFDVSGAVSAENAMLEAEDVERRASAHVARARRLLVAARERDEATLRAQREAEAAAVEAEIRTLTRQAEDGPEVAGEVKALLALVDARAERWKLANRLNDAKRQLFTLNGQLGRPADPSSLNSAEPYAHIISERVEQLCKELADDPRVRMLAATTPNPQSYQLRASSSALDSLSPLAGKVSP